LQYWLNSSQRATGENSLFMLIMQGLTLLKNIELFAKKTDCGSLPIHPTHQISHHLAAFCSVMSRNVSKEWCFHHTRNYSTQSVKWLTAVFEHWMERLEWVSKNYGDYCPWPTSWLIYVSPMSIRNRVAKPEWETLYNGLGCRKMCKWLISPNLWTDYV
jgi:hypothetical protein